MFPLHDRMRRRIGLIGFLLLCIVPTILIIGWGVAWNLPSHVRGEAKRIGRQLGLDVSLGDVEHLRPGAVRLRDVTIRDCEERVTVLHCAKIDAVLTEWADKEQTNRRVLVLKTDSLNVDSKHLPVLGKLTRRLLELRAGNLDVDLKLTAEQLELASADDKNKSQLTLSEINGTLRTDETGTRALVQFRVPGQKMIEPAAIILNRNRDIRPPCDEFALCTGGAALPCSVLGQGIPAMRHLGAGACFQGYLHALKTPDGWQGEIRPASREYPSCRFANIEFDRLVTERFPHTLSGTADVTIHKAVFRKNRISLLHGTVVGGPGQIGSALLRAAAQHLCLQSAAGQEPPGESIPYDRLSFAFYMTPQDGLILFDPQAAKDKTRPIMVSGQTALLGPTVHLCPASRLLRTLAPPTADQAPFTQQTDFLARFLPAADAVPASEAHRNSRVSEGQTRNNVR